MKVQRSSLEFDRRDRTYIAIVPDEMPAAADVVIYFHGSMQSSNVARNFTGNTFDALADQHGVVICYPDGVHHHFNDSRRDFNEATRRLRIDDVGFTRELVAKLRDDYSVGRVFAAGYSNGGQMVTRLLHDAPGLLDGAALFAAPVPAEQNMLSDAAGWEPTPVLMVHGTADDMVPYAGGAAGYAGHQRGEVRSAIATAEYYAGLNGSSEHQRFDPMDTVVVDRFTGGATTELWSVEGMGHVVPSPKQLDARIGPGTDVFTGAEVVAKFFGL
ncbi:PHB depolymerase family esterase [Corynebacterium breve]|uniref:PHB depolymerase family esterase n=1 Tax=Corynebacterium breve TaxID=3049799 RepID=A0ABY8VCH3_9CORY|nr:PHB depolymerase family esterase [Corynebacterium breve]WIM67336.1 PHB depolymerase family esterase [Corynebacterium breve]